MSDIHVYTGGLCHCSVCAPKTMPRDEVVLATNSAYPTGLDHGWTISPDSFKRGEPNPCECNTDPDRLHYLMVC